MKYADEILMAYADGELVKDSGHLYRALQAVPAGTALTNTAYWENLGNYTSLGEAVSANLTMTTTLVSDLDALSSRTDVIEARLPAGSGLLATDAQIIAVQQAVVDGDSANADDITAMQSQIGGWATPNYIGSQYPTSPTIGQVWVDTGVENQALQSEDLTSGSWAKTGATVALQVEQTDPRGFPVFLLTETLVNSLHTVRSDTGVISTENYSRTVRAKKGTARYVALGLAAGFTSSTNTWIYDFDTGTFTAAGNPATDGVMTATALTDGWVEFTLVRAPTTTNANRVLVGTSNGPARTDTTFLPSVANTLYIAGGVQVSNTAFNSRYVKTTTVRIDTRGQQVAYKWDGDSWEPVPAGTLASAIDNLSTRATSIEGVNVSQATDITNLKAQVGGNVLGPELIADANFSSGAKPSNLSLVSVTATYTGGEMHVTSTGGSSSRIEYAVTGLEVGQTYKIVVRAKRGTTGSDAGQQIRSPVGFVLSPTTTSITTTSYVDYVVTGTATATSGTLRIYLTNAAEASDVYFDRVSFRKNTFTALADAVNATNAQVTQDGENITAVTTSVALLQAAINDASTGLATKASITSVNTVTARLNNTGGGRTVEQVASALVALETAVNDGTNGLATKASITSVSSITTRLNDVGGGGKTVEQVASDVVSVKSAVEDASNGLATKASITSVNTVQNNLDSTNSTVSAQGTSLTQVKAGLTTALPQLPSTFEQGSLFFTNTRSGTPDTVPDQAGTVFNDGEAGPCLRVTNWTVAGQNILTKGTLKIESGRVYRLRVRFRVEDSADGSVQFTAIINGMDYAYANGATITSPGMTVTHTPGVVSAIQVMEAKYKVGGGAGYNSLPAGVLARAGLRLNTNETGLIVRIISLEWDDITGEDTNANAISSLTGTVTTQGTTITSQGTAITAVQASIGQSPDNLVLTSNFDDGTVGKWAAGSVGTTTYGGVTRQTLSGIISAGYVYENNGTRWLNCNPGDVFDLSAVLRTCQFRINFYDINKAFISSGEIHANSTAFVSGTATAPANSVFYRIAVRYPSEIYPGES